jgi:hypothetical protein
MITNKKSNYIEIKTDGQYLIDEAFALCAFKIESDNLEGG